MRLICFDLETRKHAEDLEPTDIDLGWDRLRRGEGGVSSLAIWDSQEAWCSLYDDFTVQAAARHLELADVVVGYSSEKFDVPVVVGLIGRQLALRFHYDIYTELARALAEQGFVGTKGDCTLDRIARRTLGRGKIDHGSHAKDLATRGRWAQLHSYCMEDVRLTRDLFHYICMHGGVIGPRGFISLDVPEWLQAGLETK